jgi:tRNA modification GTPase
MTAAVPTIAAPATAPGRAAIAMVRISGPLVETLVASRVGRALEHRRATRVRWRDRDGRELDDSVAVFWKGPASYTGEDVLELSLHGNPLLVRSVLEDLACDGVRLAAPGEFTRRALEHGKLSLSRAEAVAAVVDAETRSGLAAARHQLSGGLDVAARALRGRLLEASAFLELETDFAEEEAVPDASRVLPSLEQAFAALDRMLLGQERLLRRNLSPRVALAGRPNAGKSSLANVLLGEDRLLVSPVRGTTRDWIEVPLVFPEGQVTLVDTAGLGRAQDELDAAAQERTRRELERVQLILVLVEAGREPAADEAALLAMPGRPTRLVRTKGDLHPEDPHALSARTGAGVAELRRDLRALLEGEDGFDPSAVALGTARQRASAQEARDRLADAVAQARAGRVELAAHHVRHAQSSLSELVGETTDEELLETIFSHFCIGK